MAYWTKEAGWQTYSLPTNARSYENDPYMASEFAGTYPSITDKDVTKTYNLWVRVEKGKAVDSSSTAQSGPGWVKYTLSDKGGGAGDQIPGVTLNSQFITDVENVIKNLQKQVVEEVDTHNNNSNKLRQDAADALNKQGSDLNTKNNSVNKWSADTVKKLANAKDGEYKKIVESIDTLGLSDVEATEKNAYLKTAVDSFDGDYIANKLVKWNVENAAQPPVGSFDAGYYRLNTEGGTKATSEWDAAQTSVKSPIGAVPDLDIVARYGSNQDVYLHWYYTTQGKPAGERGNRPRTAFSGSTFENAKQWATAQANRDSSWYQGLSAADKQKVEKGELYSPEVNEWYNKLSAEDQTKFNTGTLAAPTQETDLKGVKGLNVGFTEIPLTDAEYQQYRDKTLGLADRFDTFEQWKAVQTPEFLDAWYKSLPSDQKEAYEDGTLGVPTLDNIPDRLRSQAVMDKGTTFLEGALSPVLGEKEKEQQKMFASMTSDTLKQAAKKLQEQKAKEQQFDFYRGLPGIDEIASLNESLTNSLLGDTGVGGILSIMGDSTEYKESLEKQFESLTGVPSRNNAIYNWQKWFDDELVKRYETGIEVVDPLNPDITYKADVEFAKDYIDRYLKPRFDNSKSMSEFISYMDIKQNEQNVFQTQSALDSLRTIADVRAQAYLDGIRGSAPLNFDSEFYYNPQGNFKEEENEYTTYQKQRDEVTKDWETAKTKGNTELVPGTTRTWAQWAYDFGLDLNNKDQFARLHYEILGRNKGFDPAKDLITQKDAEEYIDSKIIPAVVDEKLKIGDITFLNFVTPEEYADKLLEGISPENQREEWDKLLEKLGLSNKDLGVEEVKQYIIESFRTGAAQQIRESIKYLNEKKITPSQKELGVEYIERPEDAKPTTDPEETSLYKIFKQAGFAGNEEDFYNDFMTDVDRSEMELLTQAGKGFKESVFFSGLSSGDPFEAVVSLEGLFDQAESSTDTDKEESAPSYFKLFGDDKEDEDYKSKSGQKILGEFTSLFKGFT